MPEGGMLFGREWVDDGAEVSRGEATEVQHH